MRRFQIAVLLLATLCQGAAAQRVADTDFSTVAQFERYTVADANGDGQTWQYDDLMMAARCTRDYDADDWLLSPVVRLDAAKTYRLTVTASIDQSGSEQLEVALGGSVSVAAMTLTLLRKTTVSSTSERSFEAVFTVPATSSYSFGFHHMTTGDPFSNVLYLHRILIEETFNQQAPAAVTGLQAVADATGARRATVSFTTPAVAVGGTPLQQLTRVSVLRDGTPVCTFDSPETGALLSFTDEGMPAGNHTYRVVPANDYGEGVTAETTVYVGPDVPGAVRNLRFAYDNGSGRATVTWDAPDQGAHGGAIDPSALTYEVRRFHASQPLATGLALTSVSDEVGLGYLLEAEEATRRQYEDIGMPVTVNYVVDGQGLMQYYVRAVSPQGQGAETVSNAVIMGEPYQLPFADSFAQGQLTHYWRTDLRNQSARWGALGDSRYPQDGDGGMLCFNAITGGETAMCHTGNITMAQATTPVLSFYYYYDYAWALPLTVKVALDGGDFQPLATVPLADDAMAGRWLRCTLPLDVCAGHGQVQVGFEATTSTTVDLVYIDNVTIIDQRQHDLTVRLASVPRDLKVGETRYLTAAVENLGTLDVPMGQYSVDVFVDGVKAGSSLGTAVAAGATQNVMVPLTASIDMRPLSDIRAEVVYGQDEAPANNISAGQSIKVRLPRYPQPTGLQAVTADGQTLLSWQQPAAPRTEDGQVTESFEDYDDFLRSDFGDWTLYDGDRALTYGIGGWHFPKNSDIQSWMIWTPKEVESTTEEGVKGMKDALWYPLTGDKMVSSFGAASANSDDWLISPELSGHQQVISFWGHSMPRASNPDQFQLYISTTGVEPTNFMPLDAQPLVVPSEWQKYEYVLPQGTRHFAIRKVTYDGWVFFVDDVTFCPDTLAAQTGLMLFGYNVYRNGTRLNTALVSAPSFSDAEGQPGDTYRVTAVYNQGESVYSEAVVAASGEAIVPTQMQSATPARAYDLLGRPATSKTAIRVSKGKKVK